MYVAKTLKHMSSILCNFTFQFWRVGELLNREQDSVRSVIESFRPVLWTGSLTRSKENDSLTNRTWRHEGSRHNMPALFNATKGISVIFQATNNQFKRRTSPRLIRSALWLNIKLQFHLFKGSRPNFGCSINNTSNVMFQKGSDKIEYVRFPILWMMYFGVRL